MQVYKTLIKRALAKNYTISVWDGEEFQEKKSTAYKKIVESVESVEEAVLHLYDGDKQIGWALVSPYGLEDDETIIDYGMNPIMEELVPE